jgi:hypothetical protein
MVEQRFNELREALFRSGVASHNVRRAVLEIESHFQQLKDEERRRGAGDADAGIEAHRRLGTNQVLVQHYAERPELLAWSKRWPAMWFVLLPLITYVLVSAATFATLLVVSHQLEPYLHAIRVAPHVTHGIELAASLVLLWVFPLLVATAYAVPAYRRRAAIRWPLAGIVLIGALTSLLNVDVTITGGHNLGEIGGGIGLSLASLPGQVMRAAVFTCLALVPLWLARHRAQRDCNVN